MATLDASAQLNSVVVWQGLDPLFLWLQRGRSLFALSSLLWSRAGWLQCWRGLSTLVRCILVFSCQHKLLLLLVLLLVAGEE